MLVRILSCCFLAIAFCQLSDQPAWAISAEEQLKDNALEARARDLSKQLRCLVCQNQSIDDSDSDLAKDLRNEDMAIMYY